MVLVVVYFLVVIDISEKEDTGEKFDDQDFEKLLNKEDVVRTLKRPGIDPLNPFNPGLATLNRANPGSVPGQSRVTLSRR